MQKKVKTKLLVETRALNWLKKNTDDGESSTVEIDAGPQSCEIRINNSLLDFDIKEYAYCCGMKEIGNIETGPTILDIEGFPETIHRDLLIKLLRMTIEQFEEDMESYGFSFTVPDNESEYDLFEEAALKVGFILVGEFVNKNSHNLLKHYILL